MENETSFFNNIKERFKESFTKYYGTLILLAITTIITVISNHVTNIYDIYEIHPYINRVLEFIYFLIFNTFAVETLLNSYFKEKWKKITAYAVSIIISAIFTFAKIPERYVVGYIFILFIIAIKELIKCSKLEIHEYFEKIFENFLKIGIIFIALEISTLLILELVNWLLLDSENGILAISLNVQTILISLYLIPGCIYALNSTNIKTSKFFEILIKYILIPIEIIFTFIIYIYMLKILITNKFPVNEIFAIIFAIYGISFVAWILQYNFKERSKYYEKIAKFMPYFFIPLWIFQTHSLIIRISAYGITEKRYIGLMLLVFEAISLFLSIYKERKYFKYIFDSAIVLFAICLIIPGINMEAVSKYSQAKRPQEDDKQGFIYEQYYDEEIYLDKELDYEEKSYSDNEPNYDEENNYVIKSENKEEYEYNMETN